MKDLLIVSNYYPPEKGAAANRIEQLARNLKKNGFAVTVVCPLANYPEGALLEGYRGIWHKTEVIKEILVKRLWIYPSKSKNPILRVFSTSSFAVGLFFYLLVKKLPPTVILQSPPLLLSFISSLALWIRGRKIILNVSDLWPTAAIELGVLSPNTFMHRGLCYMERYIYRRAYYVLGQSEEIITHVKTLYPSKNCFLYRNYPEHETAITPLRGQQTRIKLFYAGLLGVAQGVFNCCKKIDLNLLPIELHLYGEGAEKQQITDWLKENSGAGIVFHEMMPRTKLYQELPSMDIALVPLQKRIYGSVPSKIFEYATLGIPILYFGGGEGEEIVRDNQLGWVVPVGNYAALQDCLVSISKLSPDDLFELKQTVKANAQVCFNLEAQIKALIQEVL